MKTSTEHSSLSRKRIATPVTDELRAEGYDTPAKLQELYDQLLDSHEQMERRARSVIASETKGCVWSHDSAHDNAIYRTGCGREIYYSEGSRTECEVAFCQYCGGAVKGAK